MGVTHLPMAAPFPSLNASHQTGVDVYQAPATILRVRNVNLFSCNQTSFIYWVPIPLVLTPSPPGSRCQAVVGYRPCHFPEGGLYFPSLHGAKAEPCREELSYPKCP